MYLIFYCRGAIPLNCHSPTSHLSTFLQDFSSEFLDVWALSHNVFIIIYTSQTHFVIPPPSSSGSGKREKERASAAVAVSSHPFPLVIFTPPSLQKRRLAHLFFFFFFLKYHQTVAYLQKCSVLWRILWGTPQHQFYLFWDPESFLFL